jgi:gluconate 2-dehydrogenase gamma chain
MNRRTWIIRSLLTLTTLLLAPRQLVAKQSFHDIPEHIWHTLDHLQQHLLPNGAGLPPSLTVSLMPKASWRQEPPATTPGARETGALNYLRGVFDDPKMDPANKELIIDGALHLESASLETYGALFHALNAMQKEKLLREIEESEKGAQFLGKMMEYLIEALLGSPVYGGNPGSIGWRWLNHAPGFPLPTEEKRYFLL